MRHGPWAGRQHWRGRRGPPPFVRRMGCAIVAMIVVAAIGSNVLVSLLMRGPRRNPILGVIVFVVVGIALVSGFVLALRAVTRVFREQDRVRRQLMADVAHELRTPLAILQGRIEGLLDGVYPRDDDRLGELLSETQHLARLVEDLRTIANAEAGALDLQKESTDLGELIRDAASSFDAPIDVDVPDDLPPVDVDPVRIREVLLNLLSNALRHTPGGGRVSIHAEAHPRDVLVRVTDTGSGIAPGDLPRIFDRFHKGRDSRGSGLGLAIAKNLVLAHGGRIDAKSAVGEGTTVTVTLPR